MVLVVFSMDLEEEFIYGSANIDVKRKYLFVGYDKIFQKKRNRKINGRGYKKNRDRSFFIRLESI